MAHLSIPFSRRKTLQGLGSLGFALAALGWPLVKYAGLVKKAGRAAMTLWPTDFSR